MNTFEFKFDFDLFKKLCEDLGIPVTDGDEGLMVEGKQMSGAEIFSDADPNEEIDFEIGPMNSNCTISGLATDNYGNSYEDKLALLAA